MQTATAVALGALGAVGLVLALVVSGDRDEALRLLISCLFMALFWGLFMWLAFRGRVARRRAELPVVDRPVDNIGRSVVGRSLISAVALTAALAVIAGVFALVGIEGTDGLGMTLGIVFGAGLWLALQARDLRRWETTNGLVLCTRRGQRRVAWTGDQAHAQLVLVRVD